MICVSVMLAIFLVWPVLFGGAETLSEAEQRTPRLVPQAKAAETRIVKAESRSAADNSLAMLTCYKRYEAAFGNCVGADAAQCRGVAADKWDLCEARGVWPE